MFKWFRRFFPESEEQKLKRFYKLVDELNWRIPSGKPTIVEERVGTIPLRSGTVVMGDPQNPSSLEVSNVATSEVDVSVKLWKYSTGAQMVAGLMLRLGDGATVGSRRKIGEIGIDSAKIIVADKAAIEKHWTEIGPARIGVISMAPDDTVLRLLKKRFKFESRHVNMVRAEIVGPVSEALEKEIEDFLKSKPEYADYPYLYFRLETNNSFDRVNYMEKAWDFIPVGNTSDPLMFACTTGRGDGLYEVHGDFAGETPLGVSIEFVKEGEE